MQALHPQRIAAARNAIPGMKRRVARVSARQRLDHVRIVLQQLHPSIGLKTAHRLHQRTAREPVTRGERMTAFIERTVLDHRRAAVRAAHRNTEARVRITADQPANGRAISRGFR